MIGHISRRIIIGIITVCVIVSVVFFALRLLPGDPAEVWLGDYATPDLIKITREKWGLDKPIWIQYGTYIKNLIKGDIGDSLRNKIPVASLLIRHYPFTLRLVCIGTIIALLIAIPAGILAAAKQNSFIDMFVMMSSFFFISMPSFWFGLILLFIFSFELGWFPSMGSETPGDYLTYFPFIVLPAVCLGLHHAGLISRMVRSTMIDTLNREYITVARSKGLNERLIRYKHALRNALSPIVSLVGVGFVQSLAGTVVLEVVYSRPGLGRLYVNAVSERDYPIIQGCILLMATGVVMVNMLVDISYGIIDPRIRQH